MSWLILLAFCIISSALASILLKIGAEAITDSVSLLDLLGNQMIWAGAVFYATAFVVYIYVLRIVPLSLAQPVVTTGVSVVTVLSAMVIFRESMAFINWIGLVLICVGIFFLFLGRA